MDPRSLNIFAETAYECLNEERSQRPNIDEIVTRLEKALELQLECEIVEHSSVVDEVGGTSSSHAEDCNPTMKLIPIVSLADLDPYYFEVISSIA
ncbi:hypothetical protein Tco_1231541 [Tanacetum coccineum]